MDVQGRGQITDNNVFIFPKDEEIAADDLKGFIEYNQSTLGKIYDENINMYKGDYPILHEQPKPLNKPDNRIIIPFAKYIVDIFNGFFIGIPPQITLENKTSNDNLQIFNQQNSFVDKLSEVAKQTSIYGRSYLFLYQNEAAQTRVVISSPRQSFLIYDDTVAQAPLYFVRYSIDEQNQMSGTLCSKTELISFDNDCHLGERKIHLFKSVPAIEFIENEERQGAFESVKTIMNAINSSLSEKANDVEAINDAYLFLKGGDLDEKAQKNIMDKRLFSISDKEADAKFLERPNGDGTQENLLNRLEEKLFLTAMVTNLNDLDSGASSAASGYSIELRMQAMRGLASNKERKFTSAMRDLYRVIFSISNLAKASKVKQIANSVLGRLTPDPVDELKFQFTRNLPNNIADEATTAKNLEGIVSKKTQLKVLSIVDDPAEEIKQMQQEEKENVDNAVANSPARYDFESKFDPEDSDKDTDANET